MVTPDFLAAQPDEWIARFYAFLYQSSGLWQATGFAGEEPGPAWVQPIIRLEDGRHVPPFDALGHAAVYLPGTAGTSLPTVRRTIAGSLVARPFLDALNLTEPDVVAEVLEIVLPRPSLLGSATSRTTPHASPSKVRAMVNSTQKAGMCRGDRRKIRAASGSATRPIAPAVLQEKSGQRQPEREEGQFGRACRKRPRRARRCRPPGRSLRRPRCRARPPAARSGRLCR
jgi:hypothetical protein